MEEIIKLTAETILPVAADVVHQLVDEDETGFVLLQESADGIPVGGFHGLLVLCDFVQGSLAANLPGDFRPGRFADRGSVVAAAAFDGIELLADEVSGSGRGDFLDAGGDEQLGDASPIVRGRAAPGEVVEEREGVCLAAAKLGGEIEDGAGFGTFAREAANDLAGESGQILSEIGAREEPVRFLVIKRSLVVADIVQMDGEFGGIGGLTSRRSSRGVTTLYQGLRLISGIPSLLEVARHR